MQSMLLKRVLSGSVAVVVHVEAAALEGARERYELPAESAKPMNAHDNS